MTNSQSAHSSILPQSEQTLKNDWHGCYDLNWKNFIQPAAFTHPAKFSRALIKRIYEHLLDEGMVKPGDTILDPFGGVGLGAAYALQSGLNWIGVELEEKFVDLGSGFDCTGLSRSDYVRFFGRWDKAARYGGRHICPDCIATAGRINVSGPLALSYSQKTRRARIKEILTRRAKARLETRPVSLLAPIPFPDIYQPLAAQRSIFDQGVGGRGRVIPEAGPHHYAGNLELFAQYARDGATARLVQGDSRRLFSAGRSRRLAEVLQGSGAGCQGLVSSPPYADCLNSEKNGIDWTKVQKDYPGRQMHEARIEMAERHHNERRYGSTPGQLGAMPAGLVSSPPFAGNSGGRGEASRDGIDSALFDRHSGGMKGGTGSNPANLDHLPMGSVGGIVSSQPYADGCAHTGGNDPNPQYIQGGKRGAYGVAVVSSPPFVGSVGSDEPAKRGGLFRDPRRAGDVNLTGSYGETPGQLGAMAAGVVASPPYEQSLDRGVVDPLARQQVARTNGISNTEHISPIDMEREGLRNQPDYGASPGQIGAESGETFWSAARLIVEQCAALLPAGAPAVWVVKAYVKNGQVVDFPGQWQALCEACGFETVHIHRAWLVKKRGRQATLEGEAISLDVSRKSFFRRLAEKKGSPSIDYEIVLCMRKRQAGAGSS